MRILLKHFKSYKKECIMGPLFKLLEASFELIIPLVVASIINKGIGGNNTGYIVKMCAIMVGLGVIGLACSLTAQFFSAKAATGFATGVRAELFVHIQSLDYSRLDRLGTSSIITRLTNDINQLQAGVNMTLRLFLRSPFIVFGATVMAFTINTKAALIFVAVVVILSIIVYGIMLITIPMYRDVQSGLDNVLDLARESISGVRVIRAFGGEQREMKHFSEAGNVYVRMQNRAGRISALTNPLTFIVINLGIIFLMYVSAIRVDAGIITGGQAVALVNYMSQILVELIKLANFIVLDIKALACASRIENILNTEAAMQEGDFIGDIETAEVEFKNVSFSYYSDGNEALENVSFTAEAGEIIGIIGGTGSGKTTLVNLIPRFYDASDGEVFVGGKNVREYTYNALRGNIGIVPQKAVLFSGTIRDNMKWGNANASDEEICEALRVAQAYDFVMEKEGGLDYELSAGGGNLSGGQKQRLTIARSLMMKPKILILDDSASALDNITYTNLMKAVTGLSEAPTLFIVSQRSMAVMNADRILVLDDGKVVGNGRHSELVADCEVYREIYESQYK